MYAATCLPVSGLRMLGSPPPPPSGRGGVYAGDAASAAMRNGRDVRPAADRDSATTRRPIRRTATDFHEGRRTGQNLRVPHTHPGPAYTARCRASEREGLVLRKGSKGIERD